MNARVKIKAVLPAPAVKTDIPVAFYSSGCVGKHQKLFRVAEGVGLTDALGSISCMLSSIGEHIQDAAEGEPLRENTAWLMHFMLTAAKAAIDSLYESSQEADSAIEQPTSLNAKATEQEEIQ